MLSDMGNANGARNVAIYGQRISETECCLQWATHKGEGMADGMGSVARAPGGRGLGARAAR
jgi:hypothetical protein